MSRAEQRTLPPAPRLGRVLRTAAEDLYYHGVRLVVANLVWGIGALLTAYAVTRSVLGLLALAIMVPLTVGLMGMATALVRERSVVLSDFARPIRGRFWKLVALAAAQLAVTIVVAFDLILGLQLGGILGVVMATVAFYSGLAIWVLAWTIWPLVTDPERQGESVRASVRLGALLVLAHPIRMGMMALVLAAITIASTVIAAAIITFAAAYVALVAAHFVLPSADRLEGRETLVIEVSEP
ncbi:MAG TPA: hypothetical protein VEW95_14065 [Candidatus Limnocylindrales bacterium]|nr:hypothetical protein [Candidatus Limnocylindrales bacterium]